MLGPLPPLIAAGKCSVLSAYYYVREQSRVFRGIAKKPKMTLGSTQEAFHAQALYGRGVLKRRRELV